MYIDVIHDKVEGLLRLFWVVKDNVGQCGLMRFIVNEGPTKGG